MGAWPPGIWVHSQGLLRPHLGMLQSPKQGKGMRVSPKGAATHGCPSGCSLGVAQHIGDGDEQRGCSLGSRSAPQGWHTCGDSLDWGLGEEGRGGGGRERKRCFHVAQGGNLERIICPRSWQEGSRAGGALGMLSGPARLEPGATSPPRSSLPAPPSSPRLNSPTASIDVLPASPSPAQPDSTWERQL